MRSLTIKNVPDEVYLLLKEKAAMHQRSLNKEVLLSLKQSVTPHNVDTSLLLQKAKEFRELTRSRGINTSPEELRKIVGEGRK